MKTIAVLIPTYTIEYSIDVLCGIADYFRNKEVKVVIAQTKIPHNNTGIYDYQYCTSFEYLKAEEIDAVIVISGIYVSSMKQELLEEIIKQFAPRPVISLAIDFKLKNVYAIKADCKKTYNQVIAHLKKEHNCNKIAFFSANSTNSIEALQRYDAFTSALDSNKLPFYPDLVFDGKFTDFLAHDIIISKYHKKTDIDFDAIVCANDMMACGCVKALNEIGVSVPEDVKIVGFDDSIVANSINPKLSTINQDIYSQGFEAAEITFSILNGEKVKKENLIPLVPKFRQSCGCIDFNNSQRVYKSYEGDLCSDFDERKDNTYKFSEEMNEKNNIITLMDTVRGANTLKQLFYNMRFILDQCDMSGIAVHFFKDVAFMDKEEDFEMPDEMELFMILDRLSNLELFRPEVTFNPNEKIFSARALQEKAGIFILNPIFSGETNYGYILSRVNGNKFADYNVYLKIINTAIAQAYEYTSKIQETQRLETEKTNLTRQSRTDELTKILNRRGFIEKGQATLDVLQETDTSGVIFFADMDGLKRINDTYGHQMGDKAIKLQAQVLKSVFRYSDVVGRLSGDEFGIVAVGMKLSYVEKTRLKINLMNEKISKENKLPFTLSISLGAVDLQKSSVLKKLLSEADKSLYEEKRIKHGKLS